MNKNMSITGVKCINYLSELKELAEELGVREDWHEPDEQEVSAVVLGKYFDNAGFWGLDTSMTNLEMEMFVVLIKDRKPVATVNLATLFAWAVKGGEVL